MTINTPLRRRIVLVLGAVILAGSWGATEYVDARQVALADNERDAVAHWGGGPTRGLTGRSIYMISIAGMAVGAAFVVLGFPAQRRQAQGLTAAP